MNRYSVTESLFQMSLVCLGLSLFCLFVCVVYFLLFLAIGTGRSKKQAKHKAAKMLLDKLAGEAQVEGTSNGPGSNNADNNSDGPYESNPIGWLQEMCMKRFMPPPRYVTEQEDTGGNGTPHERMFTVACVLKNFREVGKGKSKKVAKRQAAHNMWQFLQENKGERGEDEVITSQMI